MALLAAGCTCGAGEDLRADGYLRCHLAEAPPEREWRHGELTLRVAERTLTIEGLPEPFELALAAGPSSASWPDADVRVLLGDLRGPSPRGEGVTLLLAGGTDEPRAWREALGVSGDDTGVIDITPLRSVRAGPVELVPVAGAPRGRYGLGDGFCGVGEEDVEAWDLPPAEPGVRRVLIAWAAPEAAGLMGLPAGSGVVSAIAARVGAAEAFFAWPRLDPRSVRPAAGAHVTRGDGSREPAGWDLLEVSANGLHAP